MANSVTAISNIKYYYNTVKIKKFYKQKFKTKISVILKITSQNLKQSCTRYTGTICGVSRNYRTPELLHNIQINW